MDSVLEPIVKLKVIPMNIRNTLTRMICSSGVSEAEYKSIVQEIHESNRKALLSFSITASCFLVVMCVLSFLQNSLVESRILYLSSALVTALIALLSHGPAKQRRTLNLILVYCFIALLMLFGILLGTYTVRTEITATYIALLLTVPQLFLDRPRRMYVLILCSNLLFVVMVILNKDPITWNSDIINCCIFGALSCITLTYGNTIKAERFLLLKTVRFMAENDQLTGLKNRNSYELRLSNELILDASSLFCIYVDVNGLHELNNSQGHAAGDRMLIFIAKAMQDLFGKENTYRVGGDEYVAIGTDLSQAEVESRILHLRQTVSEAGYHIAIGLSYQQKSETALNSMVRAAEREMYLDKDNYYRSNNLRHSRD